MSECTLHPLDLCRCIIFFPACLGVMEATLYSFPLSHVLNIPRISLKSDLHSRSGIPSIESLNDGLEFAADPVTKLMRQWCPKD